MEFQAEMKYVLDTIWLLIGGALVMWMAAGLQCSKNPHQD